MPKKYSLCMTHGHQQCIEDALTAAEALCKQQGLRLTPLRKQVLELVWQSHQPVGAYDVLAQLGHAAGKPAAPPTVYRALDFLLEHGFIHRIASLNAFIGCVYPEHSHHAQFLICRLCQSARELPESLIEDAVAAEAEKVGFLVEGHVVEITGLCAACRSSHA